MSKSASSCVVHRIANSPSGKVALGEPWKKAWMAIAQNRLPFGFHIHIIDLWIFYTVFTTPLKALFAYVKYFFSLLYKSTKARLASWSFISRRFLCLFCLNVCTFSNAHSRSPHLCGFWGKYLTVFILYKNHFVSPSTVIVASSVGSLNVYKGRVLLCLSCRRLCEEVSQVLMLILSDVPAHLNPQ